MLAKKLNLYIAKNFFIRFLQVILGFSLIIFFINLIDTFDKVRGGEVPLYATFFMAFLRIPDFINDVVPSLVLMSSIITFFSLSSKSEITIIRSSGFSVWQIIKPVALSAVILGTFWTAVFGPISISMMKKFNNLEGKHVRNEIREAVAPKNGIWLRQNNLEIPGQEIIIQARKVYKENIELEGAVIWFFDEKNRFYKKLDAKKGFFMDGYWKFENVIANDGNIIINQKVENVEIPTDLEADFIIQKVLNNFQNVKLFSIYELSPLIKDLKSAGFSSVKFQVYMHSLLSKPLLFLAMVFIACYFGLNHIRNSNSILMIFIGIIIGMVFYITSSIINAFGSSGLLSAFASTWVIAIVCLATGILLIYQKEKL